MWPRKRTRRGGHCSGHCAARGRLDRRLSTGVCAQAGGCGQRGDRRQVWSRLLALRRALKLDLGWTSARPRLDFGWTSARSRRAWRRGTRPRPSPARLRTALLHAVCVSRHAPRLLPARRRGAALVHGPLLHRWLSGWFYGLARHRSHRGGVTPLRCPLRKQGQLAAPWHTQRAPLVYASQRAEFASSIDNPSIRSRCICATGISAVEVGLASFGGGIPSVY